MRREATLTFKGQAGAVVGKDVRVHIILEDASDYDAALVSYHIHPWYEQEFGIKPGAFEGCDTLDCGAAHIYQVEGAWGQRRLLAHEIGHALGLGHPDTAVAGVVHAVVNGFPTMAFTGLLRWADPEQLLPLADQAFAALAPGVVPHRDPIPFQAGRG